MNRNFFLSVWVLFCFSSCVDKAKEEQVLLLRVAKLHSENILPFSDSLTSISNFTHNNWAKQREEFGLYPQLMSEKQKAPFLNLEFELRKLSVSADSLKKDYDSRYLRPLEKCQTALLLHVDLDSTKVKIDSVETNFFKDKTKISSTAAKLKAESRKLMEAFGVLLTGYLNNPPQGK